MMIEFDSEVKFIQGESAESWSLYFLGCGVSTSLLRLVISILWVTIIQRESPYYHVHEFVSGVLLCLFVLCAISTFLFFEKDFNGDGDVDRLANRLLGFSLVFSIVMFFSVCVVLIFNLSALIGVVQIQLWLAGIFFSVIVRLGNPVARRIGEILKKGEMDND